MSYQPIENYGIIGNLNTIALVGMNGAIDFMCLPEFDSPSIFASLLNSGKGGTFHIYPEIKEVKQKQLYIPETNVLLTRFLSEEGVGEIGDFMPINKDDENTFLMRRVKSVRGSITFSMDFRPRYNYGRTTHKASKNNNELYFTCDGIKGGQLRLVSDKELEIVNGDGHATFTLAEGETADFIMEYGEEFISLPEDIPSHVKYHLFKTVKYWRDWVSLSKYKGRWVEMVNRSALVLKLLTSRKYGSIVAAPTFGIPEHVGGERNWDYRYTWIRDASFTVYAFSRLGYMKEAEAFLGWIGNLCEETKNSLGGLQIMYKINGGKSLEEEILNHMEGYKKSSPVRIGNNAYDQLQLDIYGELLDAVYLFNKYGEPISNQFWNSLVSHIEWLCEHWRSEDEGIWEVRGGRKHFLYSRFMCWVAVDRAIKIATQRSFPYPHHWLSVRDAIYNSIYEEYWDDKLQSFMQYKGAQAVDASALLMPLIRFISPKDPKWLSTLKRIEQKLVSDSLVYRYRPEVAAHDGLRGTEGTFSVCTFWYVECLAKAGQLDKAQFFFEKMLSYSNHLGLYSEQLDLRGEHLGNFPQAFTHLGLISAAYKLNDNLNNARNKGSGKFEGFDIEIED